MKSIIKKNVLPVVVKLNLEDFFHWGARGNILNIFYHGLVNQNSTHIFARHIEKGQFEMHMKYLHKKFNVISLDEAFLLYRENIKPDVKTVTVSFDDGYLNNLETALPIIEKYRIKTTFFISGICSDDNNYIMWYDFIAFARFFLKDHFLLVNDRRYIKKGKYDLVDANGKSIYEHVKKLSYNERNLFLNELEKNYNLHNKIKELPPEFWKLMDGRQIKQLSESEMVTIGSHGYKHYNLDYISLKEAEFEMQESKKILTEITGKKINLISFPDGSYNDDVKKIARNTGYDGLLAVDYRCKSDYQDKSILNRWGVSGTTTFESVAITLNKAFIKHAF